MNITDKITITNEENMELMKRYSDNYFDVAIVDPEYGIGESKKNHKSRNTPVKQKNGNSLKINATEYEKKDWDNKPPGDNFFDELRRVSLNQIIFGGNYFSQITKEVFKPPRRNEYDDFIKNNPKGWVIWDKMNGGNDFNDCELIYTSYDFDTFIVYYMWNGMMQGLCVSENKQKASVQQGNKKLNEKRFHPTLKPIKIYQWMIRKFNLFRLKVLDTNLGVGSIILACIDAECMLIACDKETDYFEKACERGKNYYSQQNIFKT